MLALHVAGVTMARPDTRWLDAQYDNRARVPEHREIFDRWSRASALSRDRSSCRIDLRYGPGDGETLDVFPAPRADAPVLVFIHGGYWRSFDKADFSFVAPSFVADGAMVVVPNYALCPAVDIEAIALQCAQSLAWVHRHAALYGGDARRIVVVGHSAGGHLAAMMLACDGRRVAPDLPPRLATRGLAVSGLYELEPLRRTSSLQADLRLTRESVGRLSPAQFPAPAGATLYTVAGALESEEFLRQNRLLQAQWGAATVPVCEALPGRNHFDILHDLADPHARLHLLALRLLRANGAA